MKFSRNERTGCKVVGYCNSNYADDLDKFRSITGYVFTAVSGPISWRSTLQPTVALSTPEAEYMAVVEGIREAVWMKGLFEELGIQQEKLSVLTVKHTPS